MSPRRATIPEPQIKSLLVCQLTYKEVLIIFVVLERFELPLALPVPSLKTRYVTNYTKEPYVTPVRFELTTHSLKGCCIYQLSYDVIFILHLEKLLLPSLHILHTQ